MNMIKPFYTRPPLPPSITGHGINLDPMPLHKCPTPLGCPFSSGLHAKKDQRRAPPSNYSRRSCTQPFQSISRHKKARSGTVTIISDFNSATSKRYFPVLPVVVLYLDSHTWSAHLSRSPEHLMLMVHCSASFASLASPRPLKASSFTTFCLFFALPTACALPASFAQPRLSAGFRNTVCSCQSTQTLPWSPP